MKPWAILTVRALPKASSSGLVESTRSSIEALVKGAAAGSAWGSVVTLVELLLSLGFEGFFDPGAGGDTGAGGGARALVAVMRA